MLVSSSNVPIHARFTIVNYIVSLPSPLGPASFITADGQACDFTKPIMTGSSSGLRVVLSNLIFFNAEAADGRFVFHCFSMFAFILGSDGIRPLYDAVNDKKNN